MTATPRSGNCFRAFTLVELLTVMAVISLLIALTVPALNGFSKSNSLVGGGDMVTNLVALARQTATSKNTMTALILLGGQGTADADYRAFTVLQFNVDQQTWVQNTPWQTLPPGVVVDCSDTTNCTFLTNSPVTFPPAGNGQAIPPVTYQQLPIASFAGRIFVPSGGLLNAQYGAQIRLVEGSVQGKTQMLYTHKDSSGTKPANYYDVALLGATGQTKIGRP